MDKYSTAVPSACRNDDKLFLAWYCNSGKSANHLLCVARNLGKAANHPMIEAEFLLQVYAGIPLPMFWRDEESNKPARPASSALRPARPKEYAPKGRGHGREYRDTSK